ncbi:thrombospondin type 3 repeat-containing protein [Winogradskyella maritima]|uniref:Thrombospondin type 3 repeat-containing protein n=1 Tax=Winogradskyella maritima TaxID=1517766 RepID=A0ABV8AFN2_9FLAO|nr:thrombospondin type 3 repeat-containing protein [Winogradskyella maritima]
MKTKLHLVLSFCMFLTVFSAVAQQGYWQKISSTDRSISDKLTNLKQDNFETYQLDINAFKNGLIGAPLRGTASSNVIVYLPNENNELEPFRVVEAPVLSDALSDRYPNIKTYVGTSLNLAGVRARFSVTPQGLQSMITYPNRSTSFTVPLSKGNSSNYISYNRGVRLNSVKDFECLTTGEVMPISQDGLSGRDADDQVIRDFDIAISTNGEYTEFWDDGDDTNGTAQEDALAQVVSTLNRNNEVFEWDMAVTFTLVNGIELIYPDPASDPYGGGGLNGALQSTLTSEVGEDNYDIGHLFAFGPKNGNAGCIGCVCVDGSKGSGFSQHDFVDNDGGPYMADFFDIDYVPHEIGHQMGANHTWSFSTEGTGVNSEPGSGTTIMGYAGITGPNDVQDHSDAYFHYHSIDQILNNLDNKDCDTETATANNAPVADAGADYTIPGGTAFVLRGAATDADAGDVLTYTWEQIDSGQSTSTSFGPTATSGGTFRSRPPSTSPDRYMPFIERVIAGELTETSPTETADNTSWETVSTVSRDLNFALTVKDNVVYDPGANMIGQSSFDTMTVSVDGSAGPFIVTSQDDPSVTWEAGSSQTVTWDVAGTDGGAINATNVDIKLSTDGGLTFPFDVATGVPNTGTASVTVPITGGDTSTARIMVAGSDNIFFAVNSSNFSIIESEFVMSLDESSVDVCSPADAVYTFTYNTFLGFTDTTVFSTMGLPATAVATFSPATASADGTVVTMTVTGTGTLAVGNYPFTIVGTSGTIVKTADAELNVYDANLATLTLTNPADGATEVPGDAAMLAWDADINAVAYEYDVASDAGFTSLVTGGVVTEAMATVSGLATDTEYFWRVRGVNACNNMGPYSSASFTTANITCNNFDATDTPIAIPDGNLAGTTSELMVTNVALITDINVTIDVTHTWVSDLTLTLTSPNGTSVVLTAKNGGSADNYTMTVFDQEATEAIGDGTAPFTGTFIPDGDLSNFYGEVSSGEWELLVVDDTGFDAGTLNSWSMEICGNPLADTDGDLVPDLTDNCPMMANADQEDTDADGQGDACDDDIDDDGVLNADDNCPTIPNPDQADTNGNGIGDLCDFECSVGTDSPALAIPDGDPEGVTTTVLITEATVINDVNLTLNITHTWVSDLIIRLTSPSGTTVELVNGIGGSGDNFTNTVLDDDADDPIAGEAAPFTGTFQPLNPLAAFNGEGGGGEWTIFISDNVGFDTGTLDDFSLEVCGLPQPDADSDGIADADDNCPDTPNTDQSDLDGNGIGDVCDNDFDGDGILNEDDNCPQNANPDQADTDGDGIGDACDPECSLSVFDGDPIVIDDDSGQPFQQYVVPLTIEDNLTITDITVTVDITHTWDSDLLLALVHPDGQQFIILANGVGGSDDDFTGTVFNDNADTPIGDGDAPFTGLFSPEDPFSTFFGQQSLGTWFFVVVDTFPALDGGSINAVSLEMCGIVDPTDFDSDGILNEDDNCILIDNPDQADNDGDGIGDVCDDDDDNDGVLDVLDNCQFVANPDQADNEGDGIGDVCDDDDDNDGVLDDDDNCPLTFNPGQEDFDLDGLGDVCDGISVNDIVSPNGDNINDTWLIVNIDKFPGTKVQVFNRWGKEVFTSSNYNNDWAGNDNGSGNTLPSGSYYYVVDVGGTGTEVVDGWLFITL